MKTVLVTGREGQVGWELARTLGPIGRVVAVGRERMDLADADSVRGLLRELRPQVIVNAAAYTAVDKAESEPELAMAVNGTAPGIMAEEARRLGALLVHYSTDYVFDGEKPEPYDEDDPPNPVSVYGRSKLAGERAITEAGPRHLILRTSWVYGARGSNFALRILQLAAERAELRIVDDQIGAPTWSRMIAEATAQVLALLLVRTKARQGPDAGSVFGIYHLTASGQTSWFGFAGAILERVPPAPGRHWATLTPIPSQDYPLPARRPRNSLMRNEKLGRDFGLSLPDWRESLALCLESRAISGST